MTPTLDNKTDLIGIRNWDAEQDRAFIFATWLRGLRFGNDWFRLIPSAIYFLVYHNVIETLLSRPGCAVQVACLKEDPSVILGYSVCYGDRLDFVFVKKAWRGIGIAKALVPPGIKTVSHLTDTGKAILAHHKGVEFNPFL